MENVSSFASGVQPTMGQITSATLADALLAADLTAGSHFRLALVLWRLADDRGIVQTSTPRLVELAHCGERAISREIAAVQSTGLIRRLGAQFVFEWDLARVLELAAQQASPPTKSVTRSRILGCEPRELVGAWLDGIRRGRGRGALVSTPADDVIAFALERIESYARACRKIADPVNTARAYGECYLRCRMPLDPSTRKPAPHPLTLGFLRNAEAELDVLIPAFLRSERDRDAAKADARREANTQWANDVDRRRTASGAGSVAAAAAAGGAR